MLSEKYEKELDEEYELLNSEESQEFTKKVLLEMGDYISRTFPGVEFELKARYKSPYSFNGKKDRIRRSDEKEKPIYDNIGFCLIVKSVSDNFGFKHAYCRKLIKERIEIENAINNEKARLKVLEMKYNSKMKEMNIDNANELNSQIDEIKIQIEKLQKANDPQNENIIKLLEKNLKTIREMKKICDILMNEIKDSVRKIEEMGNGRKKEKINLINEKMATHIMNKMMSSKEFLNSLKLEKILGRTKSHDGGKSGYYIAFHDALKSKVLKYWMVDLHAMSYENYEVSKLDHSQGEGKARIFPRIDSLTFKEEVLNAAPRNLVYQNATYIDGVCIKPGTIYVCSEVENVAYFYAETLVDKKDTFEYVISDNTLFSGEGKKIEKNYGKMEEKVIKEDEMEL